MAYPQTTFSCTELSPSSLLGKRREAVSTNTLLYQLQALRDTGRYDAFKLKWHKSYSDPMDVPPVPNHLFWDSDVAKWIEGACYFLSQKTHPSVESAVHELVEQIRSAQQSDGYLNIHYTVVEPGKRFTNLRDMHELYNAGHLIEAALAHNAHFHNEKLLEPIKKYADLLCALFGPGNAQSHGYPGHPEIELALLRLAERTDEQKYYKLAEYFLLERGNSTGCQGRHFYDVELERRGADITSRPLPWPDNRSLWYMQAHRPISEQHSIEGHSVRAVYLLTAVADLVHTNKASPSQEVTGLRDAMYRLWDNMVLRKMYVTGGIGAVKQWEGFGSDYFLPQGTDEGGCYAETCASIGVMMLAERILQIDLDGRFADVMELNLYNAVLTAMSHDGKEFTYVNQLASSNTDLSKREKWFTCACCPPNILRVFGSLAGYVTSTFPLSDGGAELAVHLYVPSTTTVQLGDRHVRVKQESNWPWEGEIKFNVLDAVPGLGIKLRIPSWASRYQIVPHCPEARVEKGYLSLPSAWVSENPQFTLSIPLKPRWIAHNVNATTSGLVSLARGPIIYCVEDFDNPWVHDHFKSVRVDPQVPITEHCLTLDKTTGDSFVPLELRDGSCVTDGIQSPQTDLPFSNAEPLLAAEGKLAPLPSLHFVPYYFRANRGGNGQMRVGLQRWCRQ